MPCHSDYPLSAKGGYLRIAVTQLSQDFVGVLTRKWGRSVSNALRRRERDRWGEHLHGSRLRVLHPSEHLVLHYLGLGEDLLALQDRSRRDVCVVQEPEPFPGRLRGKQRFDDRVDLAAELITLRGVEDPWVVRQVV